MAKALRSVVIITLLLGFTTPASASIQNHSDGKRFQPRALVPDFDANRFVKAAYQGLLGRNPESSGLNHWVSQIEAGASPGLVLHQIGNSVEQRRHVVTQAYIQILHRMPDEAGLQHWATQLIDQETAGDVHALFLASTEYFARSGGTNGDFIAALYRDVLRRTPDPQGWRYWVGRLDAGADRRLITASLLASPEAILQPELSITSSLPTARETTTRIRHINLTLDRDVLPDASTIFVSVAGQQLPGTTIAGVGAKDLVFTSDHLPSGLQLGEIVPVVVTVFAYDGFEVARVDYQFNYRAGMETGSLDQMLVAFYGYPGVPVLGVAGEGTPQEILPRLLAQARPYQSQGRPVVPAFELIATLVTASPGPDGLYRRRADHASIEPYLEAIRTVGGQVILDIQPGRADFLDEARSFESLLAEPDVGLAMDPEWVVGPDQTPAGRIGTVDASTINRVSAYLSDLVTSNGLPDKLLIVHRFRPDMVTNTDSIVSRPGVVILFQADGEGGPGAKIADYNGLLPPRFARGFKVFYDEDSPTMSPTEVLRLDPDPDYVSYQ